MKGVPFMRMWWTDFFDEPLVAAMPVETQGIYLLLLGKMWLNGGWLPDNDAIIAHKLGIHLLTWKMRHKPHILPLLTHGVTPVVTGGILTQKRLTIEWGKALDHIEVTNKKLAKARAQKAAKSKKPASMVEPKKRSIEEPAIEPAIEVNVREQSQSEDNKALPIKKAESFIIDALTVDDGSLRPAQNGAVEGSALNGSPGLEGRSPAEPSERVAVPIMRHSDIRSEPTPALLRSKLVKATGLMAAIQEDDDADET